MHVVNYIYKQIHIEKKSENFIQFYRNVFPNESPFCYAGTRMTSYA